MSKDYWASRALEHALSNYKDWKHPLGCLDTPQYRQTHKKLFCDWLRLYKRLKGISNVGNIRPRPDSVT